MKKRVILSIFILMISMQFVFAVSESTCDISATLLNQDPYPAVPGESVKNVFQLTGLENPGCGLVKIEFIESFPFSLDPESKGVIEVISSTFLDDYGSFLLAPYKVRVDADALKGDNQLELQITSNKGVIIEEFNINIEDLRTDFEVSIKDYDKTTQIVTFEILNIGEHDVEALTIDIPKQETIKIKGSPRNIVGSLDSNDDTTFDFEAKLSEGDINLIVTYTDEINERRTLEKTIDFDSDYFNGRASENQAKSIWFYITLILIGVIVFSWYKKKKKR